MVPPKFVVLYQISPSECRSTTTVALRQFFLLVEGQRFPDEVPETAVVAALDGELIAVGVVDLFNAAGRRAQNAQGQIRLLGRLLP